MQTERVTGCLPGSLLAGTFFVFIEKRVVLVVLQAFQVLRINTGSIELIPIIGSLLIDPIEQGLELDKL